MEKKRKESVKRRWWKMRENVTIVSMLLRVGKACLFGVLVLPSSVPFDWLSYPLPRDTSVNFPSWIIFHKIVNLVCSSEVFHSFNHTISPTDQFNNIIFSGEHQPQKQGSLGFWVGFTLLRMRGCEEADFWGRMCILWLTEAESGK